jgi:hypothetical protein
VTKPSTRTILAAVVAAVAVVIAATAAVVAVAVHRAPRPDPQITAYAHGKSVTVPPFRYCTVSQANDTGQLSLSCKESGVTAALDTPPGSPVQLSLPRYLADAPWHMVLEYSFPDGTTVAQQHDHHEYPNGTMALTINSRPRPDLHLVGIEMQLLVPIRDETGNEGFAPFQAWSLRTA